MADKRGKTGGKSCFSDYGHGYRLGYCCSPDEFHVFFQIVGYYGNCDGDRVFFEGMGKVRIYTHSKMGINSLFYQK